MRRCVYRFPVRRCVDASIVSPCVDATIVSTRRFAKIKQMNNAICRKAIDLGLREFFCIDLLANGWDFTEKVWVCRRNKFILFELRPDCRTADGVKCTGEKRPISAFFSRSRLWKIREPGAAHPATDAC